LEDDDQEGFFFNEENIKSPKNIEKNGSRLGAAFF
jgi:hypothetical protein